VTNENIFDYDWNQKLRVRQKNISNVSFFQGLVDYEGDSDEEEEDEPEDEDLMSPKRAKLS
jgi:hypothetical protein